MLNSLYGKFASTTSGMMKEPFLNEEEDVKYIQVEKDNVVWSEIVSDDDKVVDNNIRAIEDKHNK